MAIPTEPIGSIPRPPALIAAVHAFQSGRISQAELRSYYEPAVADTVARFEATGSCAEQDNAFVHLELAAAGRQAADHRANWHHASECAAFRA